MSEGASSRPVTATQIVTVVASTLALFFMVAFATESLEVHRLKERRDQLLAEQERLLWEREELETERERRRSPAYVEEIARMAGKVREGEWRVIVITATPNPATAATPQAAPAPTPIAPSPPRYFDNPNWEAWRVLIGGFD